MAFASVVVVGHIFIPETTVDAYAPIEILLPAVMGISVLYLAVAWRWEAWGGGLSFMFFCLDLALYWIIRGNFFPVAALITLSPLPLTAILFFFLGRADRLRLLI
jgi:hypothetical protein